MENRDQSCKTSRWRLLKSQLNNLEPKAFQEKINSTKNVIIVDCRTNYEFANSHINGAINISYLADTFWDEIEQLSKSAVIFVYCRTGRRSIRACTLMRNGGFDKDKIYNLDGGYVLWEKMF